MRLIKLITFITIFLVLWLGPENIFLQKHEATHITISILAAMLIITINISPQRPKQIANLNQLRKQLKFQWHKVKQDLPFDVKSAELKLVISPKGSGCKTIMQNLCAITTEDMPFAIDWLHDDNSIIIVVDPELAPKQQAQHLQAEFKILNAFINKKMPISYIYTVLDIKNIMQDNISIDAYNYVISALSNTTTPIKIILTKCDQIAGFTPYFEYLEAKQENWQVAINNANFDQQYNTLIAEIDSKMLERLQTEAQHYRRVLIKDFPIQIEKLRSYLQKHLAYLVNNWQVISIAFSSGTQDGNYTDLISNKTTPNENPLPLAKQRYFCDQLFTTYKQKKHNIKLTTETWFQIIASLTIFTIIMIISQALWLTRFQEAVNLHSQHISQDTANRKLAIAKSMETWLQSNPMPKYFGHNIWPNYLNKLKKSSIDLTQLTGAQAFKYLKNHTDPKQAAFTKKVKNHINLVWQNTVVKYYLANLADKYPFNNLSSIDADLSTINKLFAMKNFFLEYYLKTAKKLNLKSEQLSELNSMEKFLASNTTFTITTTNSALKNIKTAEINVGSLSSNLTQKQLFNWPNNSMSIWLQNKDDKIYISSRHGLWALFRLIQDNAQYGTKIANISLPLADQKIDLIIKFNKPLVKLDITIPEQLL